MEKMFEKLEVKFNKELENFEKTPLKTSLKWLVIFFVVKKVYSWIKDE